MSNKKNKIIKKQKGSVLVFSLFVMMISLIIGVSLMSTSSIGRKSSLSSAKSINSFQVADSGIEYAFREIREYKYGKTLDSADLLDDVFGTTNCNTENGFAVYNGSVNGGSYKLYFYRKIGASVLPMISCGDANSRIDNIAQIKAVGTYGNITRSVEASVDLTGL